MNTFKRRPYQAAMREAVHDALCDGYTSLLATAATGTGKTVCFSDWTNDFLTVHKWKVLVLAPRKELINQAYIKIRDACGLDEGFHEIEKEMGTVHFDARAKVVVGCINTCYKETRLKDWTPDVIICDECFPAGTMVDGIPIEHLCYGDPVLTFNTEKRRFDMGTVTGMSKKRPSLLMKVVLSSGRTICCTPEHPFFVRRKEYVEWRPAHSIMHGCEVLCTMPYQEDADDRFDRLFRLYQSRLLKGQRFDTMPTTGEGLLLGEVQRGVHAVRTIEEGKNVTSGSADALRPDESEQPDGRYANEGQDAADAFRYSASAESTRRERPWPYPSTDSTWQAFDRMEPGVRCSYQDAKRLRLSNMLQVRYSQPHREDRDRSGRRQSSITHEETAGSEKNRVLEWVRVDRVEILEPGSDGAYGGMCPDGFVYNLEVSGQHNFFADGILVHNCHFCMSDMWKQLFARFPDAVKIGLTATAMRGDRQPVYHENIDGSIFQMEEKSGDRDTRPEECGFHKHVYDYPLEDAVSDGWLVEPRGFSVHSGVDISGVSSRVNASGDRDFGQAELNKALSADQKVVVDRINKAITKWKEVAADRPTIVFCPSVEYSHWAANLWRQAGFTAAAIDARTEDAIRDRHIEEIHLGNVQVTCNYGIYTHGTDVDKWSCIVLLRPTESQGLLSQMLGRVTRPLNHVGHRLNDLESSNERRMAISTSGKPDSIVIDIVDIVGKHKLATLPTTLGLPANLDLQGRKLTDAAALVKQFEEVKKQVLYDCPATYEELEARLKEIDILTKSGARYRDKWMVREDGNYSFGHAAPGYSAVLLKEGSDWRLMVRRGDEKILERTGSPGRDARVYFDKAADRALSVIEQHRKEHPKSHGTITWIMGWSNNSGRWALRDLRGAGFSDEAIDALGKKAVFPILQSIRDKQKAAQYA